MPRMLAVEDALEGKHHVVGVQRARRLKPAGGLKLYVRAQVETVGCAVIQNFPAFRQLGHQTIGVRVDVQQTVVELGGEGVDNQPATGFLRVKRVDLSADAVDKAAVANVGMGWGERLRRGHRLAAD